MTAFARNSIRVRMIANTVLVCGAALFLAYVSLIGVELVTGRRALVEEISTIATVLGHNSAGAVAFDDAAYAETLLSGLRVRTDIVGAQIRRRDGTVLATYVQRSATEDDLGAHEVRPVAGQAGSGQVGVLATVGDLLSGAALVEIERPITLDGETIGRISIVADLSQTVAKLKLYTLIAGIGILLLFLASTFVAWRLHRRIYGDISNLVGAMAEIAGKGRYDIRARKSRNDELGYLVDGFNAMLDRLESRDNALHRAMDRAEEANRAKSRFLAAMSHELRTPLNAIIGFSDIMMCRLYGPLGDDRYTDYIRDINQSAQHLLNLINDILDLSKVESGMDHLSEECIDVDLLIHETVKVVEDRARRERIDIAVDVAGGLPLLRADRRKVKQILLNLLSNAVKFTPAGGTVTQEVWSGEDGGLLFRTTDTGIGIAPEDVSKAMSVFGQVDDDLSRKYEGTGLGLPLSVALAEQHGGTLTLYSELGEGTVVTVHFPPERNAQNTGEIAAPGPQGVAQRAMTR